MAKAELSGFQSLSPLKKRILLKALGYVSDDKGFLVDVYTEKRLRCKYTKRYVSIQEAAILPGSTVIINATPVSMASYIEEYLEDDDDE